MDEKKKKWQFWLLAILVVGIVFLTLVLLIQSGSRY